MKLNFQQTAEGAAPTTTPERTHKVEINAIALSRHAAWEVESRLLLSRIAGTKNVRDPQLDQAYSSSASYSPTEDADCAGSLPLMWEGILIAKLVKAAMRRLWHRDLDDEDACLKTAPTLQSAMLKSKFTIPIGEPGKPRLLCVDPSKMLNDEQAIRNHETSIRNQLNPSNPSPEGGPGSSTDPIQLDQAAAPIRLFPSAIHAESKVATSQVTQLAQQATASSSTNGSDSTAANGEQEARRETFQAGTHPGEKDMAEPYDTAGAGWHNFECQADGHEQEARAQHQQAPLLNCRSVVLPHATSAAIDRPDARQSVPMFINELRTSKISNARASQLKSQFAVVDEVVVSDDEDDAAPCVHW